jgi:prepilin-type N-terminal cleavage/methylation domain-containing protein
MRAPRPDGMTLAETLVSLAILAVLGLVLLQIYTASHQAYGRGTGQIALQQKARFLMEKMTPLLLSAAPPHDGAKALYSPDQASLIFYVPDKDFQPRNPQYVRVGLYHNDVDQTVWLENSVTPYSKQDEMFRSRELARDIYDLRLGVPTDNTVRVTIEIHQKTRAAGGDQDVQEYILENLVQIPYYSKN